MAGGNDVTIRSWRDSDSFEELTELLHRGYAPLAAMGFKYFATHQTPEQTRKRIAAGSCLVAEIGRQIGNQIVGTITWYRQDQNPKCPPLYRSAGIAHFGQFTVEPPLQRRGIGQLLIEQVERDARAAGCTTLALDTAETATHLVEWYRRLGFREVGYTQWDVTNYRSVIMSKTL